VRTAASAETVRCRFGGPPEGEASGWCFKLPGPRKYRRGHYIWRAVQSSYSGNHVPTKLFRGVGSASRLALLSGRFVVDLGKRIAGPLRQCVRVVFGGPVCRQSGSVLRVDARGVQDACSRILHDKVGQSALFKQQQTTCNRRAILRVIDRTRELAEANLKYPLGSAGIVAYANLPMPKRAERLAALNVLTELGLLDTTSNFLVNRFGKRVNVVAKVKPEEICKGPDYAGSKPPRLVASLGSCAALRAGHAVDEVKAALASGDCGDGWWDFGGPKCRFVKSVDMKVLYEIYNQLPTTTVPLGVVFSDDGGWAIPTTDHGVVFIKTDISSCDTSIGPAVFRLFDRIGPTTRRVDWDALIAQTKADLTVGVGPTQVKFRPVKNVMYSGWSGTTLIDTIYNMSIFGWVFEAWTCQSLGDTLQRIYARISSCGSKLTLNVCSCYEEFDFVKTFPALGVDGNWYPQVVLGTVLRTYGQKKEHLPGRGSIESRGYEYHIALTVAMKHFGDNIVTEAFRRRFCGEAKVRVQLEGYMLAEVAPGPRCSTLLSSVARRYSSCGVSEGYLALLAQDIMDSVSGDVLDARELLDYDYGYQLSDTVEDLYYPEVKRN